jgi:hypothetical protein
MKCSNAQRGDSVLRLSSLFFPAMVRSDREFISTGGVGIPHEASSLQDRRPNRFRFIGQDARPMERSRHRWSDVGLLMSVYWHSPSLLAVIDTEQFDGWENLYRSYQSQSRNPSSMGIVNPTRVQVQLLKPDLAFGIVSWTMRYPENAQASEVVGTTTMDLQKFGPEWKIVAVHTSFTEM